MKGWLLTSGEGKQKRPQPLRCDLFVPTSFKKGRGAEPTGTLGPEPRRMPTSEAPGPECEQRRWRPAANTGPRQPFSVGNPAVQAGANIPGRAVYNRSQREAASATG